MELNWGGRVTSVVDQCCFSAFEKLQLRYSSLPNPPNHTVLQRGVSRCWRTTWKQMFSFLTFIISRRCEGWRNEAVWPMGWIGSLTVCRWNVYRRTTRSPTDETADLPVCWHWDGTLKFICQHKPANTPTPPSSFYRLMLNRFITCHLDLKHIQALKVQNPLLKSDRLSHDAHIKQNMFLSKCGQSTFFGGIIVYCIYITLLALYYVSFVITGLCMLTFHFIQYYSLTQKNTYMNNMLLCNKNCYGAV